MIINSKFKNGYKNNNIYLSNFNKRRKGYCKLEIMSIILKKPIF